MLKDETNLIEDPEYLTHHLNLIRNEGDYLINVIGNFQDALDSPGKEILLRIEGLLKDNQLSLKQVIYQHQESASQESRERGAKSLKRTSEPLFEALVEAYHHFE